MSWYSSAMERSHRMERVNEMLRNMLGPLILEQHTTNDLVTIVGIWTTRDLKDSTIKIVATQNVDEHVAALNAMARSLQAQIKPKLDLKIVPNLRFEADTSGDNINRVEGLLDQL